MHWQSGAQDWCCSCRHAVAAVVGDGGTGTELVVVVAAAADVTADGYDGGGGGALPTSVGPVAAVVGATWQDSGALRRCLPPLRKI